MTLHNQSQPTLAKDAADDPLMNICSTCTWLLVPCRTLTRTIALKTTSQISGDQFEAIDSIHYEFENKLIRLIESLERKRDAGNWISKISEESESYNP